MLNIKDTQFREENQELDARNKTIPFELVYPSCFVEYNRTTSQGESIQLIIAGYPTGELTYLPLLPDMLDWSDSDGRTVNRNQFTYR